MRRFQIAVLMLILANHQCHLAVQAFMPNMVMLQMTKRSNDSQQLYHSVISIRDGGRHWQVSTNNDIRRRWAMSGNTCAHSEEVDWSRTTSNQKIN